MSRNRTCLGVAESSGRSIVFGRPQHSAVAAVSLSRRNTLSPAIMDASSTARRCASVNQHGTDTTQSGDAPLLCASAAYATLRHYMQLMCVCTRAHQRVCVRVRVCCLCTRTRVRACVFVCWVPSLHMQSCVTTYVIHDVHATHTGLDSVQLPFAIFTVSGIRVRYTCLRGISHSYTQHTQHVRQQPV